ncbi:mannitol dehydrogenase family protein [Saccharibacillus alkalitolerans]|uniref:Mannitol dehydrogenase family protein n=1 Tax=Saccharibacillus alkalitolerans TaxID=2705290 RepID=A0ABX0FAI8_9BACL|nr:mannitol dehydrogenase family protein [Saccharibacillus alkalitolerans]NGZ76226.1 mannitol dehydrogenase family protein [Saccharibacillus alkalitolerans]
MLELNERGLGRIEAWQAAGVELPRYDRGKIAENTLDHPRWLHFGAGNIFRSLIAKAQQKLLNEGLADTGIIAAGTPDSESIDRVYRPHDNLTLLVEMAADGHLRKEVLASVAEALCADPFRTDDYARLVRAFENPSLQLVSFTVTEKGYALTEAGGAYTEEARRDFDAGPERAEQVMAAAAALAYRRYLKGAFPLAFVSLDNCPHNGDVLRTGLTTVAREWAARGLAEEGFVRYLEDRSRVSFPLTMIDKITPRPSAAIREELTKLGIGGLEETTSSRHTHAAPFVNAETAEYLVIEDDFPAGRPPLEAAGILFADRETVNRTDRMKVTACLNPLHTALAVTGCLLGYARIADEMRDPLLRRLAERIGRDEGLPVVEDPGILPPEKFLDEVLNERLPNPFIPDTPQRIASDTSKKIGIRFGHTIRAHKDRNDLDAANLTAIPLAVAAWCRYLLGIDDTGTPFEPSPDPRLDELRERLLRQDGTQAKAAKAQTAGLPDAAALNVRAILADTELFGVDLYEAGLGAKIEGMFRGMLDGPGAVRRTLERELGYEAAEASSIERSERS